MTKVPLGDAMRYTQVGMVLIVPMLVLGAFGYWLDGRFGTSPWLLLGGLVLGMAGGFANFVKLVQELPDDRHSH